MCAVVVAARDEAATIAATLAGLGRAFPGAHAVVADDGSRDATAALARAAGAAVVGRGGGGGGGAAGRGKGAAMTRAARVALEQAGAGADDGVFVLCDGDLGGSAERLGALAAAVVAPGAERIAVAAFTRSDGGGFGIALGFARVAVRRRTGRRPRAPMSGQRALRGRTLRRLLPFAGGFGMELGIALDAARAGIEVVEVELDLTHRVRGRTPAGFAHRARQLAGMLRAYLRRVGSRRR